MRWADNVPSLPVVGGTAALIVGDPNLNPVTNATIDPLLKARLEADGYAVEVVDDNSVGSTFTIPLAEAKNLVVISETCGSAQVAPLAVAAVPIVIAKASAWDAEFHFTTVAGAQTPGNALDITSATHPVASGLTGRVSVYTVPSPIAYCRTDTWQLAFSGQVVARVAGSSRFASIFTFEKNALLLAGNIAPERRVGFFLNSATMRLTVSSGIPESTINVAAGTYVQASPLQLPANAKLLGGWNSTFTPPRNPTANVTTISGGGASRIIDTVVTTGSLVIDGFTFTNAYVATTSNGGAINSRYQMGASTITACTFDGNVAYEGAAVYIRDSAADLFTISNCTFVNNRPRYRSTVWIRENVGWVKISQCAFTNNRVTPEGATGLQPGADPGNNGPAGLRLSSIAGPVVVDHCTFTGNHAFDDGAAMAVATSFAPLWISDCTFSQNIIDPNGVVDGDTPALQTVLNYENISVTDCVFDRNVSNNDFGAIEIQNMVAPSQLLRCSFIGNRAPFVGTISFRIPLSGDSNVTDCIFDGNIAGDDGAAIRWDASSSSIGPTVGNGYIDRCVFVRNRAGDDGIIQSRGEYGSGMFAITNCTFFNNYAADRVLHLRNMNFLVHNCTFTSNSSQSEMIRANQPVTATNARINTDFTFGWTNATWAARRMEVVNCIFSNNVQIAGTLRTLRGVEDVTFPQYNTLITKAENNIFFNLWNGVTYPGAANPGRRGDSAATDIVLPSNGNFEAFPLLANEATGDLHLQAGSPAIDVGQVVEKAMDLDGVLRPQGTAFDIGAYEYYALAGAPSGLLKGVGDAAISLTWNAASGYVTGYRIYMRTLGGPYTLAGETTGRLYTVTGLTNGQSYYFVVRAVNPHGESANSNEVLGIPQLGASLRARNWNIY